MHRRQRSIVAGVHRLQHVQRLAAAHLAHHDTLGAHAQRIADQIANGDQTRAIGQDGRRFQAHHMRLSQLQFGRIFHRADAFVGGDE